MPTNSNKKLNFTLKNADGKEIQLEAASFQRRIVANSLDLILIVAILQFVSFFIYKIYNIFVFSPLDIKALQATLSENIGNGRLESLGSAINFLKAERLWIPYLIDQIFSIIFTTVCAIGFWHKKGQTPGKMLANCYIIDLHKGETSGGLSLKKAILRFFISIISLLSLGLGFVSLFFSKKGQAFHDIMAGTSVVVLRR